MTADQALDQRIEEVAGWRGDNMTQLRELITKTAPELKLEWKWGTAIWTSGQTLVVGLGVFKGHVKINFMQGAKLPDPDRLFNAGLEAKTSRATDIHEGETVPTAALQAMLRTAVAQAAE